MPRSRRKVESCSRVSSLEQIGGRSPLGHTADTVEMYQTLVMLWQKAPVADVLIVTVTLMDLSPPDAQLSLFDGERHSRQLWAAIDWINAKCGVNTVYVAPMHGELGAAPRRIPFGKPPDLRLADVDERDGVSVRIMEVLYWIDDEAGTRGVVEVIGQ